MTAEELKEKYGAHASFTVPGTDDKEYQVFLKKPSRMTLGKALTLSARQDLIGLAEVVIQECIVAEVSDKDILFDDEALMNASVACSELINFKGSELKKL